MNVTLLVYTVYLHTRSYEMTPNNCSDSLKGPRVDKSPEAYRVSLSYLPLLATHAKALKQASVLLAYKSPPSEPFPQRKVWNGKAMERKSHVGAWRLAGKDTIMSMTGTI